jgi:NAD(P)-dependent dehydrogenase (short-subunit alcohol dehydrogenase family)
LAPNRADFGIELSIQRVQATSRADAEAAVRAAVDRCGRIEVLVNNAASFYAGYFEELTCPESEVNARSV